MLYEDVSPVHTFHDGSVAIRCGFCEGNGSYPENPLSDVIEIDPCPVCAGKGLNVFPASTEYVTGCRCCGSSGKGWDENGYFSGDVCPACQGKGVIGLNSGATRAVEREVMWSLIHPAVTRVAKSRFEAEHYADSVEAALKEVNLSVKRIVLETTGQELDGVPLMNKAFSVKNPVIRLSPLSSMSDRDIQQGYMQLFAGTMVGIRNPKAHENVTIDRACAIHLLFLSSLLMSTLDERL